MAMDSREQAAHRNTELGDRACFCVACGWARRYYPGVVEPPEACPDCEGAVLHACPSCSADVLSIMATECDVCGQELRANEVNGVRIRRPKRLPLARPSQQPAPRGAGGTGPGDCAG